MMAFGVNGGVLCMMRDCSWVVSWSKLIDGKLCVVCDGVSGGLPSNEKQLACDSDLSWYMDLS